MDKSDIQRTHRLWQMLRKLVKYGITALTVLCTIHSILLSIGYDFFSVHLLLCSFLYVLGLCLSRLFNLCWVHKTCVVYTCTVVLLVVFRRQQMFHMLYVDLDIARVIMSFVGLIIIGCVIWKTRENNC